MTSNAINIQTIAELLTGIKTEILSRGGVPKFPLSTLPELNQKIWGLHKGLTVVGARSSMGKSAFVLQIARDLADQMIPVWIVSLEMDVPSMIERLFCQQMEVDNFDLLSGKLNYNSGLQQKWDAFEKWVSKIPLLLTSGLGKNFGEINDLVAKLNPKPKIIIVDYIQGIRQSEKERSELNEYIRNFRQLMIEGDMVGILASQMNRAIIDNTDKRPSLENLKSTGVLEEHADMVLMLFWEYFYTRKEENKNKYEVIVGKNRNGRTGHHELYFKPEYYLFQELGQAMGGDEIIHNERMY